MRAATTARFGTTVHDLYVHLTTEHPAGGIQVVGDQPSSTASQEGPNTPPGPCRGTTMANRHRSASVPAGCRTRHLARPHLWH